MIFNIWILVELENKHPVEANMRRPVDCTYGMRYFMALKDMKDIRPLLTGYALQ